MIPDIRINKELWNCVPCTSAIYFLYNNDELIYISQSRVLGNRLEVHVKENYRNELTHIEILFCHQEQLSELESKAIYELQPRDNIRCKKPKRTPITFTTTKEDAERIDNFRWALTKKTQKLHSKSEAINLILIEGIKEYDRCKNAGC